MTRGAKAGRYVNCEWVLPVHAGCCDQSRTLHNQHMGSHSTGQKHRHNEDITNYNIFLSLSILAQPINKCNA